MEPNKSTLVSKREVCSHGTFNFMDGVGWLHKKDTHCGCVFKESTVGLWSLCQKLAWSNLVYKCKALLYLLQVPSGAV